ncbi:MAG: DUF885 domain-containing protein [Polyangiales bacterium]
MNRHPVFALSESLVDQYAALRPMNATMMGVAGHDHRWDDLSPAGVAAYAAEVERWEAQLDALPPAVDRWDALAVAVCRDWVALERDALAHADHRVDLNNIASPFQTIRMVFDQMSTATPEGWEAIAARLFGLPEALAGYRASLSEGLSRGELVAARQVRACVEQGRVAASKDGPFGAIEAQLASSEVPDELAARVREGVRVACAAYGELTDWLNDTYLPRAPEREGVGRARYLRAARRFVGAEIQPEETHAWGWSEVRRLQGEILRLGDEICGARTLPELYAHLRSDPAFASENRETFLETMRARQARAMADLDGSHFDIPAAIRHVDVKVAPPGGPLGAYYVPPSEDLSRPGSIWYSLSGEGPFPLYDEVTTAYHEGFPGHHLQCGLQVYLREKLCRVHRLAYGYSGYAEGWALYAEQLMDELGYFESPAYRVGMLAMQLVRACRVAFDVGAHLGFAIPDDAPFAPGEAWTFERGVEFFQSFGGLAEDHAVSEVTRYLGWPGQAISYKVGQREMLALRDAWIAAGRGPLKEFHHRVLDVGNVSLDMLRELVLGPDARPTATA